MNPDRITARLARLREELKNAGQLQQQLEAQQVELQRSALRISGAIQVLEELMKEEDEPRMEVAPSEPGAPRIAGTG